VSVVDSVAYKSICQGMIRAAAPLALATSTKGVNGMSISVRSNDQRSTEELMIELGDAGIAKLLMRRFQLLERVEEFLRRPCNGIMFALRLELDEQRNVIEEDERVRKLCPFLSCA
jgi:hypothetical protein